MTIGIFCSANSQIDPDFFAMTEELGRWIGENGHKLVFGGCNLGLMECVARAVREAGGRTIGVVPRIIEETGRVSDHVDVCIPCDNLSDRKDLLLAQSDVLSLHCPLTPDTRHLINSQSLALMKPSAILINTGRGPLIDDQDVADALNSGRLRAFCADVLTDEPPRADNPLLRCDNAFVTPHIAWATIEARRRLIDVAVGNVKAFIDGQPRNAV